MVIDANVYHLYQQQIHTYFQHYNLDLSVFSLIITELDKSFQTLETIIDAFIDFGLVRKEPVLVVGGGLITDAAGFACATYRRNTNYIRIPTTLIGLIDASVAIKVAINHNKYKNCLGAYHASQQVILDFSFLKTLPLAQIRNGMAELVKIAVIANQEVFEWLEQYGEKLLYSHFGYLEGSPTELKEIGHKLTYEAIKAMLELEVPNLHELDLDRVIAYGHTWSPTLELAPQVPMFHGHAVNIDMALSATIAEQRGYITTEERHRIFSVMSDLSLALDHPLSDNELLWNATRTITLTRNGKQRVAMPRPLGTCCFVNDLTHEELEEALTTHKRLCMDYPHQGSGLEISRKSDEFEESQVDTITKPVTPIGILVKQLKEIVQLAKEKPISSDLMASLEQAYQLAAGIDPYLNQYTTPKVFLITDPQQILDFDFDKDGSRYLLKSIAYDSVSRLDMTQLPFEGMASYVKELPISPEKPWVMQEFIKGQEYCTHSTVRKGIIRLHCCSKSSPFQINYEQVDNLAIDQWVQTLVQALNLTGQISLDFIQTEAGTVYPIECNPRTHSAIIA